MVDVFAPTGSALLTQAEAVKQAVTSGEHHVAVRGDELPLPTKHFPTWTDNECGRKAFGFRGKRREKDAAVTSLGPDLFVRKPPETKFLKIKAQSVRIQKPRMVFIDAQDFSLVDEKGRNMAVPHIYNGHALSLASSDDLRCGKSSENCGGSRIGDRASRALLK